MQGVHGPIIRARGRAAHNPGPLALWGRILQGMGSRTQWEKLPSDFDVKCGPPCAEKARYRNRKIFSSGNIGVWQYFCETHALADNLYVALPEMPLARNPEGT